MTATRSALRFTNHRSCARLTCLAALLAGAAVGCSGKVAHAGAPDQPDPQAKVEELSDSALIQVPRSRAIRVGDGHRARSSRSVERHVRRDPRRQPGRAGQRAGRRSRRTTARESWRPRSTGANARRHWQPRSGRRAVSLSESARRRRARTKAAGSLTLAPGARRHPAKISRQPKMRRVTRMSTSTRPPNACTCSAATRTERSPTSNSKPQSPGRSSVRT